MFANKIKLTQDYIDLIVKKRKEHQLTAYELSEQLGRNKSWIPNIENHRTKNISKENLLLIFDSFAKEENMDTEKYILKYLHPHAIVQLDDGTSIPCEFLQNKYGLSPLESPPHEIYTNFNYDPNDLPQEETIDYLKDAISGFYETILNLFPILSQKDRKETIDSIRSIAKNYKRQPFLTTKLLAIDYFPNYPADEYGKHAQQYLDEVSALLDETKYKFDLANAKAEVYSFFVEDGNMFSLNQEIANFDFGSYQDLEYILSEIEQYVFAIYKYVHVAYEYSGTPNIDLKKIYFKAKQFLKLFLHISNISYDVEFTIPENDSTKDIVNATQLNVTNMLYEIKKKFHSRYNIPEEPQSPWS